MFSPPSPPLPPTTSPGQGASCTRTTQWPSTGFLPRLLNSLNLNFALKLQHGNKILTPPTPPYFLPSVLGTSSTKHVSYIGVLKVQSCFWASKNQAHTFFQSFTFMANILKIKLPMLAQYDSLYTRCLWTMV